MNNNKKINDKSVFIVAELSANHGKDFNIAAKSVEAIKKTGADAVKLQTYKPDSITIDCDNEYFKIKHGTIWDGRTLYNLYKEAYTPWEWHPKLKKIAEDLGLIFFSTPFDKSAVDFLENLKVSLYKVASFEITDIPLIEYIASKGKPIMISTGIAKLADIEEAVAACRRCGNAKITLLKCTSSYPSPIEDVNLLTMINMEETFNLRTGLSDHTMGSSVAIAAAALGAKVIEKHFILDKSIGGPDTAFSMEPKDFKQMVDSIRDVEKALGKVNYELTEKVKKNREISRSLFVVKNIKKGEVITESNVRSIRPGYGLHPKYLKEIVGKKVRVNIRKGTPFSWDIIKYERNV